jgi:hypothetical protein
MKKPKSGLATRWSSSNSDVDAGMLAAGGARISPTLAGGGHA